MESGNVKNHHGHGHHHSGDVEALGGAFLLNFIFTLIEIAGGLWTNSVAILADALHDAGDSLALLLSWFTESVREGKRSAVFLWLWTFITSGRADQWSGPSGRFDCGYCKCHPPSI